MISTAFARFFELIFFLLILQVLLTWVPNIKWHQQPFLTLKSFSEIFFGPFRRIIPPVGMLDLSPIVAFICLNILAKLIVGVLVSLGL